MKQMKEKPLRKMPVIYHIFCPQRLMSCCCWTVLDVLEHTEKPSGASLYSKSPTQVKLTDINRIIKSFNQLYTEITQQLAIIYKEQVNKYNEDRESLKQTNTVVFIIIALFFSLKWTEDFSCFVLEPWQTYYVSYFLSYWQN